MPSNYIQWTCSWKRTGPVMVTLAKSSQKAHIHMLCSIGNCKALWGEPDWVLSHVYQHKHYNHFCWLSALCLYWCAQFPGLGIFQFSTQTLTHDLRKIKRLLSVWLCNASQWGPLSASLLIFVFSPVLSTSVLGCSCYGFFHTSHWAIIRH